MISYACLLASKYASNRVVSTFLMKDCIDIKIYYEDTDCGGVVYYGRYLGFLERARTEYLEDRGISLVKLMGEGIYFVVAHVDIKYHASARYADMLSVCSELADVSAVTVTFRHRIFRKNEPGKDLVTASVKLASVGREMKPLRMAGHIVTALQSDLVA